MLLYCFLKVYRFRVNEENNTSYTHIYFRYARGLLQPQVLYKFMTNVISIVFDVYASVYLLGIDRVLYSTRTLSRGKGGLQLRVGGFQGVGVFTYLSNSACHGRS